MNSMKAVDRFVDEFAFLGNFFKRKFIYKNRTFGSKEAAFQSEKCINDIDKDRFTMYDPYTAKKEGRKVDLRPDWENVKEQVMKDICDAFFRQHPDLMDRLLMTGNRQLIEGNRHGDDYWGVDDIKGGQNRLSIIIMELRDEYVLERRSE